MTTGAGLVVVCWRRTHLSSVSFVQPHTPPHIDTHNDPTKKHTKRSPDRLQVQGLADVVAIVGEEGQVDGLAKRPGQLVA